MKIKFIKSYAAIIVLLFLITFAKTGYSQASYKCDIRILPLDPLFPKTLSFELWMKNTGTTTLTMDGFQAGINFNYAALANGEALTGSLVPGTTDPRASATNCFIDPVSKQIRLTANVGNLGNGVAIPNTVGLNEVRIGKYNITRSLTNFPTTIPANPNPNFAFSFETSSPIKTKTILFCLVNGGTKSFNMTNPSSHIVLGGSSSVPTLSEWGLIILVILLIGTGATFIFKRQSLTY